MVPSRLGPYRVERELGRGGMGIVYLAHDERLHRRVAIKVVPEAFAADPERLARFEREARLLAALSHQNIAGIHGIEESDGARFLVLEYVEGETLADRLHRGALPLDEALDVCRQIAAALEAAHEAGIVHRDLKPANVSLTPAGVVKVLDFGLARGGADSEHASRSDVSRSPTIVVAATGAGMILGTAAYMSPEQARGRSVDRRTDIWSFGAVLYECLSGCQAFAGETASDSIALILQGVADDSKLPVDTPERVRRLIGRCLEKDARRRQRDIGDVRLELEELESARRSGPRAALDLTAERPVPARAAMARRAWLTFGVAGLAVGALGAAWLTHAFGGGGDARAPVRFVMPPPAHTAIPGDACNLAISPDGRTLAFVAADTSRVSQLWLRPIGSFDAHPLPGTEGAVLPFWSPDGRQIGFFAGGNLERADIQRGAVEIVCAAPQGRGGSWSRNGTIVFAPTSSGPLFAVPAGGGTPRAVTAIDTANGETAHRWPCFLPDGERFTYVSLPPHQSQFDVCLGALGAMRRRVLMTADGAPACAPGYLVFARHAALMAQRFDAHAAKLAGDPFTIGTGPNLSIYLGSQGASVSQDGVLAWVPEYRPPLALVWLDRAGRQLGTVDIPAGRWAYPSLSNDGRHAAVIRARENTDGSDVWMIDLERSTATRVTFGESDNSAVSLSPDGREIVFSSNRTGTRDLYRRILDGPAVDQLILHSAHFKDPCGWTPDGRSIVVQEHDEANSWDLRLLPAAGGATTPLVVTPFQETGGRVSPDGRWLLYESDESGTMQAYVQSFPTPGHKQLVAKSGAIVGNWSAGGREILLLLPDGHTLVSVPVTPGPDLRFGSPHELFRLPDGAGLFTNTSDGTRFLGPVQREPMEQRIAVAVDWRAGAEPK